MIGKPINNRLITQILASCGRVLPHGVQYCLAASGLVLSCPNQMNNWEKPQNRSSVESSDYSDTCLVLPGVVTSGPVLPCPASSQSNE